MFPSYTNQSTELQCKSIDCFLYDGKHWFLISSADNYFRKKVPSCMVDRLAHTPDF